MTDGKDTALRRSKLPIHQAVGVGIADARGGGKRRAAREARRTLCGADTGYSQHTFASEITENEKG